MIRKLFLSIIVAAFSASMAFAQETHDVNLECKVTKNSTVNTSFATFAFELQDDKDNVSVKVTIENTMDHGELLLFSESMDEKELKQLNKKPRIVFIKNFPATKGQRKVSGIEYLKETGSIAPSKKLTLGYTVPVTPGGTTKLEIPAYVTREVKRWWGAKRTEIMNEEVVAFDIHVKTWTKEDSKYVEMRDSVVSLEKYFENPPQFFCNHEKHDPPLAEQKKPYQDRIDSLRTQIYAIVNDLIEIGWMSDQEPRQEYKMLVERIDSCQTKLNKIEEKDCGTHKKSNNNNHQQGKNERKPKPHKCSYCSMSVDSLISRIKDSYTEVYTKRIKKKKAINQAKMILTCAEKNMGGTISKEEFAQISEAYKNLVDALNDLK